ncbi:hypothetical protein PAXRUDRAFT_13993 [Paxillus rubicundulus Ve08.2h10]|uniref:Uncharacterized protein n=1 Tax=Paxillus rubicundulus Ve08.2h10 TaxID=930991 RepID=A0A0D0D3K4_9AGAM|nr:hypothetical protein PAXRUDRAFT_13993 [Paxillus rubicundulus Ve08.2h10]
MNIPQGSSDAMSLDSSLEVLLEALKAGGNGNEKEGLPGKRQQKKELDLGIDYSINAANHAGLKCRRKVFDYTREWSDYNLHEALQDWHENKTAAIFGWAALNDLGPSLLMTNVLLDRIIDCAHHHKIHTIQELWKETSWTDSEKYGEVLTII